ncbi:hypothetical protein HYH02_003097 [Chlamydomonas schloesseri]|uniref:BTB domain-containing protein n=1 Tax=Chlamydomonas schloesseri TaxID=2026947 RepID=A0A836B9S4_9CHLO|nr:hypothetical protein HYH02_003097 [Chlamydomonas schloesseri]|eukprot:KAG2452061.1 hypothetical protein HYH02_003097 [Chlamydomonas schloesseri]
MGTTSHNGLELAPPMALIAGPGTRPRNSMLYSATNGFYGAVFDVYSLCLWVVDNCALLRVEVGGEGGGHGGTTTVHAVAGDVEEEDNRDGAGANARFDHPNFLACDGHGRVFVEAGTCIRVVRQPPSWRAYGSGGGGGCGHGGYFDHYGTPAGAAAGGGWGAAADARRASGAAAADPGAAAVAAATGQAAGAAAAAAAAGPARRGGGGEGEGGGLDDPEELEEAVVSTMQFEAPSAIKGLAYVGGGGGAVVGHTGAGAGAGAGGAGVPGGHGWRHANGVGGGGIGAGAGAGAHARRGSMDAAAGSAGNTPQRHPQDQQQGQGQGQGQHHPEPYLVFATRSALYKLSLPGSLTGELGGAVAAAAAAAARDGGGGGGGGRANGIRDDGAGGGNVGAAAAAAAMDAAGEGAGLRQQGQPPLPPFFGQPHQHQHQQQHPHQQHQGGRMAAVLLAGREDEIGEADGPGAAARFTDIWGIAVDAAGNVYLADRDEDAGSTAVRVYSAADGCVSTVLAGLEGRLGRPAVLPNGYLALCGGEVVQVLDLGIAPPRLAVPGADGGGGGGGGGRCGAYGRCAAGGGGGGGGWGGAGGHMLPPRSLPADLGALLDAQPDGTADLTIRVGERRFPVHRAILSARCDYFKQRLAGDAFEDARAAELELPDADPDAFALLLRWLYTGGADVPSDQARSVAELADRLLLPELCAEAQGVVASSVTAGSVVDCLLWAWGCCESRGPGGFGQLLGDLKGWYLEHHDEVLRVADASLERLSAESPRLMVELMRGLSRSAKRARLR